MMNRTFGLGGCAEAGANIDAAAANDAKIASKAAT
jgi:hypothetical protein